MSDSKDVRAMLVQERRTRRLLETLLKGKNLELYRAHQSLQRTHHDLESRVEARTRRLARLNRDCLAAHKQAECASKAKSQFLANISHELRTPLNGVFGMLQLLQNSELDEPQLSCVQTALDSGEILLEIIENMLDLASLEAGELAVAQAPFDLRACLDQLVRRLTPRAEKKCLRLQLDCHPGLPDRALGDSIRIAQVLTHLLDNAVKFTESGDIRIEVRPGRRSENADEVCFLVHDTGIGIAHRHQEQIFSIFSPLDDTTIRKFGGSGLGLPICRHLVRVMGGQIGVKSDSGNGTTFWFTLDLPAQGAGPALHSPQAETAFPRVLLVDQDPNIRRIGFKLLTNLGCRVGVADSVESAHQQLLRQHFELVFLAAGDGSPQGPALARLIRTGARGILDPQIPLIGMLPSSDSTQPRIGHAGMTGTLTKPLLVAPLRRVILRFTRSQALLPSQAG